VSCEGNLSGYILVLSDKEVDSFPVTFRSLDEAKTTLVNQNTFRVPFFSSTGNLMFILQIETEVPIKQK